MLRGSGSDPRLAMRPATDTRRPAVADKRKKRDIVVFWTKRASKCAECGDDIGQGRFLTMEGDRPLCMTCADLHHMVFLMRGYAGLTRRARKYARLSPVVVRFSAARKRYERQGVLVDEEALSRAERECATDKEIRKFAKQRAAIRRFDLRGPFVKEMAERIGHIFPGSPPERRRAIAELACLNRIDREGVTLDAKRLDKQTIELAVEASARHSHTEYDTLRARDAPRTKARRRVRAGIARRPRCVACRITPTSDSLAATTHSKGSEHP